MIQCESIMADKGLIYIVDNIGPRTEPYVTMIRQGDVLCMIRCNPLKDTANKSKVSVDTVYKDRMINCVK